MTVDVQHSPIHGLGVFARKNLAEGATVIVIDDAHIVADVASLSEGDVDHCDYLADGQVVLMQPPERHINHSCDPNVFVKTVDGKRHVIALRPIPAGQEITYDYCINGFGNVVWQCNCGSPRCRRNIHSDFFHLPFKLQVEYLPLLDDWYIRQYRDKVEALRRRARAHLRNHRIGARGSYPS
jgi:hypothetical protein